MSMLSFPAMGSIIQGDQLMLVGLSCPALAKMFGGDVVTDASHPDLSFSREVR